MPENAGGGGSATGPGATPLSRSTLLIADDDERIRILLARVLEQAGYAVLSTDNGRTALDILADVSRPLDLLLTDHSMPGMSGPELIKQAALYRPRLKVICLSARVKEASVSHGVRYEPKPFSMARLLESVKEMLSGAG